ncbi:virulence RhuM family protein [Legionella donaldsonii]|uniref:virulence RhuM family protein n=1 Tax=Legionella donaldsonii TaxID=45060 RepID=UPI00399CF740
MNHEVQPGDTEFLLYQTADGSIRIETRMQDESVWLTQDQMSELFNKSKSTINEHIKNIFSEGELIEGDVMRKFGNSEFSTKPTHYYNLDVIISVGYRVKSQRGTQFRIWATQRLREYIIKGFAMDDERLKNAGGGNYFNELLARIRDIRSSEKVFWRKILDIYATSIDYDKSAEATKTFFRVIQNKMHWAAHGHTAAEIIHQRADADKLNMGMTNWTGSIIRKNEAEIAKNYLTEQELDILNRIVTMYLEFAEVQALSRKPMTMNDWISKLDDFLRISDRELLTHAGKISNETALKKAHEEYEKFRQKMLSNPSKVEEDFIEAEKEFKQIESISKGKKEKH